MKRKENKEQPATNNYSSQATSHIPPVSSNTTARQLVEKAEEQFRKAGLYYGHGTDNPHDEAVYLVLGALGLTFGASAWQLDKPLDCVSVELVRSLITRRIRERMPTAYLIHQAWFCGLCLYVDERVLIPRSPLAELIQDGFAPWMIHRDDISILDIGTGSGCIAIACALAFPDARVDAVDVNEDALAVARMNIERHQVTDRIRLMQSDVYENLGDIRYDLIVANPPYVGTREFAELPREYRYEPEAALRAGEDGLEVVRSILEQSGRHLTGEGILVVEVGAGQDIVAGAFPRLPFTWLEFEHGGEGVFLLTANDLAGYHE